MDCDHEDKLSAVVGMLLNVEVDSRRLNRTDIDSLPVAVVPLLEGSPLDQTCHRPCARTGCSCSHLRPFSVLPSCNTFAGFSAAVRKSAVLWLSSFLLSRAHMTTLVSTPACFPLGRFCTPFSSMRSVGCYQRSSCPTPSCSRLACRCLYKALC